MADWETITDHAERILQDALSQDRSKPRIVQLLTAIGQLAQYMEDICDDLVVERTLEQAIGKQLDQYGILVGEPRLGATDDDYRRFIKARILANNSESKPDDLIKIFAALLNEATSFIKFTEYIAAYEMQAIIGVAPSIEVLRRMGRMLESVRPIGVGAKNLLGVDVAFILDKEGHGLDLGKLGMVL